MSPFIVVIPAFNEARTVGRVVAEARRHAQVLVVDDGSSDHTGEAALGAGATVISLGRRLGKGAALEGGARLALREGAKWMITLDGDGQHDPDDIPLLREAAEQTPGAIVVGGRLRHARTMSRSRRNACRVASFFVDWVTGVSVRDSQSGFRCYPLELFATARPRHGGFVLETELLIASAQAGGPIVEVDVSEGEAPARRSRFRPVRDGCAVGSYLSGCVALHCLREAGAAVRAIGRVVGRERRRARHAELAASVAEYSGVPYLYATAFGSLATRRALGRLRGWWQHPRRRRASVALSGIAASPALLLAALAHPVLGRLGADLVSPLVDRFFSQDRLDAPLVRSLSDLGPSYREVCDVQSRGASSLRTRPDTWS